MHILFRKSICEGLSQRISSEHQAILLPLSRVDKSMTGLLIITPMLFRIRQIHANLDANLHRLIFSRILEVFMRDQKPLQGFPFQFIGVSSMVNLSSLFHLNVVMLHLPLLVEVHVKERSTSLALACYSTCISD